ncbi:MAG: CBS domain-containing protein [Methanomicrobiales archaeon]|nr:CBS domain-containing protein [Methanomicrobiales archaeon]
MDLSLIQKEILITLIALYHRQSTAIKGEDIAEVLKRNPGTVRNQMQALKALGLVDGVPGPKGGYNPTTLAYRELNMVNYEQEADVSVNRNGDLVKGVRVAEIDFTTLCHPDVCHALIKLIGSVKVFRIGDEISIGPTPVNKLIIRGEIIGKDEVQQSILISISEMISLPKKPIKLFMKSPLITLKKDAPLRDAIGLFASRHIHGAPIMEGEQLLGIVTLTDIAQAIDRGLLLNTPVQEVMTRDVVEVPSTTKLYEVIKRYKERKIGRIIVVEDGKPVGILTHSDIIGIFPSL